MEQHHSDSGDNVAQDKIVHQNIKNYVSYSHTSSDTFFIPWLVICILLFILSVTLFLFRKNLPNLNTQKSSFQETSIWGTDKLGRVREYIVLVINDYYWFKGTEDKCDSSGVRVEICNYLDVQAIKNRVNRKDFKGIICFGNTSWQENLKILPSKRLLEAENRAQKRANKLA